MVVHDGHWPKTQQQRLPIADKWDDCCANYLPQIGSFDMSLTILPCREQDLPAIVEIYNDIITTTNAIWNDDSVDLTNRRQWWQDRLAISCPVLVARERDDVLGYGSYGPFRPQAGYRTTVEHSVYVKADAKGRGIGRAVLAALENQARANGIHAMVGAIAHDNAASIALHRALGFEETARMPEIAVKSGAWQTLVLMQKIIA
jgi:L-amino acid N-acyltransferase